MVQVQFEADQARTENYGEMGLLPVMGGGAAENVEMEAIGTCFTLSQAAGGPSTYGANQTNSCLLSIRRARPKFSR